jgi:hypothetical protein
LLFGLRDLLHFTAISQADGMGTFFITSIFMGPISSGAMSCGLLHHVLASDLHFCASCATALALRIAC